MTMLTFSQLLFDRSVGWSSVGSRRPSVATMFVFYVLPLSLIPPLMIYFSGHWYDGRLLPTLSEPQLQLIAALFLAAELIMVPLMAYVIQQLGEVVEIRPTYREAFALAAVAPTPLWLAPLFLFVPSLMLNMAVTGLAMVGAAALIYHGSAIVFGIREKGHNLLMAGSIFAAGLVAWVLLMVLTLVAWNHV